MAPSSSMAVVLTLLAMGVMSGVQAKPVHQDVPTLDITSSIKIGRPHFGEKLGPLFVGQELSLVCSSEAASGSVSLSWWEGDTELASLDQEDEGIISSSFTIDTLRLQDNGRRFICQDKETLTSKAIELYVVPEPVLDITSSITLGRPIFGDALGPFAAGQPLTLTCSTEASASSVSLSWWEGGTEMASSIQEAEGIISSSFTIDTLRVEDNGRRFTCQDQKTLTKKTTEILISADELEIVMGDSIVGDGETVERIVGESVTANCVVQGYNPGAGSWREGETELKATVSKSIYATSSELSLEALTVDDSGRSFTCRALDGQLAKTVTLVVTAGEDALTPIAPKELYPALITCIVVLIVLIALVWAIYFTVGKTSANKKAAVKGSNPTLEESEAISGGIVNCAGEADEKSYSL